MNSWKQYPNLFVGKFKVRYRECEFYFTPKMIEFSGKTSCLINMGFCGKAVNIENCTLIARKIESMSDGEKGLFYDHYNYDRSEEPDFGDTKIKVHYRSLLYLLSIGVYPFDQSHFDTGEVIDSKTSSTSNYTPTNPMKYHPLKEQIEDQGTGMEQYIEQRLTEMLGLPEKYMGNKEFRSATEQIRQGLLTQNQMRNIDNQTQETQ